MKVWKQTHQKDISQNYDAQDSFSCYESVTTPRFCSDTKSCMTTCHSPGKEIKLIYLCEATKHNTVTDLWAIFEGRVYDVTSYAMRHPEVSSCFLSNIGKDATNSVIKKMPTMIPSMFFKEEFIGKLDDGTSIH